MTKRSLLLCLVLAFFSLSSLALAQSANSGDIEILNSDENGIVFRYDTPELKTSKVNLSKAVFDKIDIEGCVASQKPGEPNLPSKIVVLAVPLGSEVEAVVSDVETEKYNLNIAPVPQTEKDENSKLGYKYSYSALSEVYAKDSPFPENIIKVKPTEFVRNQRIVKIVLYPVQFNPKTKTAQFHKNITIRINFIGGEKDKVTPSVKDPFEYIYKKTLINYEQGKNWRRTRIQKMFKQKSNPFDYSDNWYKIKVKEDGLYCLTRSDLSNAGITGNIDVSQIRIFNGGGRQLPLNIDSTELELKEISLWIKDKNSNSYFDNNDSLLFYGWSCNGWDYDSTKKQFRYYLHSYDSVNVFWLNFEGGFPDSPKRMEEKDGSLQGQPLLVPCKTKNREHIESNSILKTNDDGSILNFNNWYWVRTNLFNATRSLPGLLTGETHNINVKASASVASLRINGSLAEKYDSEIVDSDEIGRFRSDSFAGSTLQGLSVSFSASIYFDWYEIEYWRTLGLTNNELFLESPDTNGLMEYRIFNARNAFVFDMSDRFNVKRIVNSSSIEDTIKFQDNVALNEKLQYYALTKERIKKPIGIYADQFLHWRSSTNKADMIIITPEIFFDQVGNLAAFRRSYNGFSVETIKLQDIYDEFSGGLADPIAIRNFLKYTFENWTQPAPFFVLLAGDGNYDHKNYLGTNDPIRIPCFTAHKYLVTDEYYVYFGNDGDLDWDNDGEVDIIISRLPVKSENEMDGVLQKVINYEQSPDFDSWRNKITLVADDEFGPEGSDQEVDHTNNSEVLANGYIPKAFDVSKIYLVEYPFNSLGEKPDVNAAIIDAFDQGTLLMNYIGHGNPDLLAHEHVFTTADIPKLSSNNAKLPLVFAATCEAGYFMSPTKQSLGEQLFNAYNKGASAVIAASSPVESNGNFELNIKFFQEIFGEDKPSTGEALFVAKLLCVADDDRSYVLFGDPAAKLGLPKLPVNMEVGPDTLSALRLATVSGQVLDTLGNSKSDFNGTINIIAYDSKRAKSHLVAGDGTLNYNLPGRTLFKGTAEIEHGAFQVQFIVPKDISYGGNSARISAYVFDGRIDGAGSAESLLVSGSDTTSADSSGPQIKINFSGQDNFREEDFIARDAAMKINLFDSSGINLTGEMGHSITLNIDNSATEIDLTHLFQYDAGSYTTGSFSYQLPTLSEGEHAFKIKAWDSANNSTQLITKAKVRSSSKFEILNLMNYPNPFSGQTNFSYKLTEDARDAQVNIFTLAGRLIKTIYGASNAVGYNFKTIWDGTDDDGDRVANGVYIYKVEATSVSGAKTETYGKAVVMH